MRIYEIIEGQLPHTEEDDAALERNMQSLYNTPMGAPRRSHLIDLGRINSLHVGVTKWPPEFRSHFFFLADNEPEPIGFAILSKGGRAHEGERFAITIIYLRPSFRQQGFATAFYRFLIAKGVALEPDTKQSAGGAAVWKKLRSQTP
jgi:GNAT superfamily N-acetyltransferase